MTIKNLEDNNKIDPRISRLVLPIGATVNMDGTALYEAVAAIFLAQYEGLDLNFGDYVLIRYFSKWFVSHDQTYFLVCLLYTSDAADE